MATFHITKKGEPGFCRATKKPCPLGGADEHFSTPEEAAKAFEIAQKGSFGDPLFAGSKVRDSSGKLLTVYHGTDSDFDSFDGSFTGGGNDTYGSGFYFSTDESTSRGYGKNLKKVQLAIANPLIADGRDGSLPPLQLTQEQVVDFLKTHPDIYINPKQAETEDLFNPLGDYAAEYWDKDEWSREEIDSMLKKVAKDYFDTDGNYEYLSSLFGKEHASAFREKTRDTLGWDGVKINFEDGLTHWVAWFPEQIRAVEAP